MLWKVQFHPDWQNPTTCFVCLLCIRLKGHISHSGATQMRSQWPTRASALFWVGRCVGGRRLRLCHFPGDVAQGLGSLRGQREGLTAISRCPRLTFSLSQTKGNPCPWPLWCISPFWRRQKKKKRATAIEGRVKRADRTHNPWTLTFKRCHKGVSGVGVDWKSNMAIVNVWSNGQRGDEATRGSSGIRQLITN